jgi:hypothetical protein
LPAADWRRWLRERLGGPALSAAATVAAAWGLPSEPTRQYWLATPVYLFAGIDSVRLHPQGMLHLPASEQQRLVDEFATVFADSPWRLTARGRRELLLAGPVLRASGTDPARLLGEDPSAGLPQGADAAMLKRLASEIELWLHEHPLNMERQRRGDAPVTALWLWGGSPPSETAHATSKAAASLPRLLGRDTYVEALWQLGARGDADTPALGPIAWQDVAATLAAPAGAVLLQPICEPPGLQPMLQQLERHWWGAARAALRARLVQALHLVTGERVHSLAWWDLARFWRARRAWWELL